jgi:integrase
VTGPVRCYKSSASSDRHPERVFRKAAGDRRISFPVLRRARRCGSARKLAGPGFAGWLQVAAFTGLRLGELDALRWTNTDFEGARIHVVEQFNAKTRTFTLPKNNLTRQAPLTAQARAALLALPHEGEFCFTPLRSAHFTPSSRAYHWKAVRAATGWTKNLYLATRHFAGWYMVNELEMAYEDVAIALGHTDGGTLVRKLYGHRDKERALDRVVGAYAKAVAGAEKTR